MASRLMLVVLLLALPTFLEASPLRLILPFMHGLEAGRDLYNLAKKALRSPDKHANSDTQRFTLFWPTNEALRGVSGLKNLSDEDYNEFIYGHMVDGYITVESFHTLKRSFRTLAHADVYVQIQKLDETYYVSSERAIAQALYVNETSSFMAYGIDTVLYVPTPSPPGKPKASSKKLSPYVGLSLWAWLLLFLGLFF